MAISVNWGTKVITVPKSDTELIQTVPTEIRKMDINWFRLQLKDLEDDVDGMPFLDTHQHNTTVDIGGITLARVVEIINGYTVTFEDGQYRVNIYGANSNIGDRVNVNQVSVSSSNSAGLVTSAAIEFGEYNGGVVIDTTSGESGTIYPIGTERRPVNNIPDAMLIADVRGFTKLYIVGDITMDTGDNCQDMIIIGRKPIHTTLTINDGANVTNCVFINATILGILDGNNIIENCHISTLSYVNGEIHNTMLKDGIITLAGNAEAHFINCHSGVIGQGTAIIDMGGSGQGLGMRNYNGGIEIRNKNGTESCSFDINSGQLKIHSTITNGEIVVRGVGKLTDNSTGSTIVSADNFLNKTKIADALLDTDISIYNAEDTVAFSLQQSAFNGYVTISTTGSTGTEYPVGTLDSPVNNIPDAVIIAGTRNIKTLYFVSDFTVPSTTNITNLILSGEGYQRTSLTFETDSKIMACSLKKCKISGDTFGVTSFVDCEITNFAYSGTMGGDVTVLAERCLISGTNQVPINYTGTRKLIDCWSGEPSLATTPVFDMNGSSSNLIIRNYAGALEIHNCTQATNKVAIDLLSGSILLESTVSAGHFNIRGIGNLLDYSTGGSINADALISKDTISIAVWDENLEDHTDINTTGEAILNLNYNNTIFIDVINGSSGSTYPIGTSNAPVDNIEDALLLITKYNLTSIHILGSLTLTTGINVDNLIFTSYRSIGNVLTVDSGVSTSNSYFDNLTVSGTFDGRVRFTYCALGELINFDGGIKNSLITNKITFTGTAICYMTDCDTFVNSDIDYKELSIGNTELNMIRSVGRFNITNKTGDNLTDVGIASGIIKIDTSCVDGNININGVGILLEDNSGPQCIVSDTHLVSPENIGNYVWNEPLTGETHNEPNSAGRKLRQISSKTIHEGTAQGSGTGTNQIQLQDTASSLDGSYDPSTIAIVDGTGSGQSRLVLEYDGTTKTATVDRNWKITPTDDTEYIIYANPGREHVNEGLARGGTINTITLNSYASSIDDVYISQLVFIRSGEGEDQIGLISSYNGTTKVATMKHNWSIIPDTTSGYVMMPQHIDAQGFADEVWNEQLSEHTDAGSAGSKLNTASSGGVDYNELANAVWDEPLADHDIIGSMASSINKILDSTINILGLTQSNFRFTNQIYNTKGNMTTGKINIYNNATDCENQTDAINSYTISVIYDTDGLKVIDYKVVKD